MSPLVEESNQQGLKKEQFVSVKKVAQEEMSKMYWIQFYYESKNSSEPEYGWCKTQ